MWQDETKVLVLDFRTFFVRQGGGGGGGAVAQYVERATPGEEVLDSILAVVGSVLV